MDNALNEKLDLSALHLGIISVGALLGAVVTLLAEEDVHLKETGVDAVTELETVITRIFMVLDREGKR